VAAAMRPFALSTAATRDYYYTQGDSDVISTPAGFRRHLVGKTLTNVFTVISLKYSLLAS